MVGAKVFISYKHGHAESELLRRDLQRELIAQGYEVLVDETLQGGDRWPVQLYDWVLNCAAAVVLASPEARASDWCQREWHVLAARAQSSRAAGMNMRVVPVRLALAAESLGPLIPLQSIEFSEHSIARIIDSLRGVVPWQVTANDYLALHRAWNRFQFENERVLGRESFSLAQVYVETECGKLTWGEINTGRSLALDPFDEKNGDRQSLVSTTVDLIENPAFRDAIVIQGTAGAGKSSFTLRLANELEAHGFRPVRLRFRDMRLAIHDNVDEMLADAVRIGPDSESRPAPAESLFDDVRLRETLEIGSARICKWVFILDGWDEVSLANSAGYQAQLRKWLPMLREFFRRTGAPVRFVITGRPSVELKDSGFLLKDTPVLTLRPMRPDQLRDFAKALDAYSDWCDLSGCDSIFEAYDSWFQGGGAAGVEMLGLPLLALLAFRTMSEWESDVEALVSSPSALYCALIDKTVEGAGKPQGDEIQGAVHKGGAELRRLLQHTAALISMTPSERISFDELQARMEGDGDFANWVDTATSGNKLHELVVNFFFKGGHQDLGCEFLHKSFREYLFAEGVVVVLAELAGAYEGPLKPPKRAYARDFEPDTLWFTASRRISQLLAPSYFSPEIRDHLFWLIAREAKLKPARWIYIRDLLADVFCWWTDGAHLRLQPVRERGQTTWKAPYIVDLAQFVIPYTHFDVKPQRTATMDGVLGLTLIQLTAWVHSVLRDSGEWSGEERPCQRMTEEGLVRFAPGNGYLSEIFGRWQPVVLTSETTLILPDIWAADERLGPIDLSRADLSRVNFNGAQFLGTCLLAANVASANFSAATLEYVTLDRAIVAKANMNKASVFSSSFIGANVWNVNFDSALLHNVSAVGANFRETSFAECRVDSCQFNGANFEGANWRGIRVLDSDLRGANLNGVNMFRAAFSSNFVDEGASASLDRS